ncbi:MAG: ABC transporter permease [Anaerolineales bacterium]|nr:ABC transporter permease [Anaerolineales bacterium]
MNKIFLIMRYELSKTFSRRSYLFFGFGIPLIAVIIVALVVAGRRDSVEGTLPDVEEVQELEVEGYVDLAGLISTIPADLPQDIFVAYPSEDTAAQALQDGEISAYYVIPEDFLEQGTVIYTNINPNPFDPGGQEWMMRWTLMTAMLGGDLEFASLVLNPVNLTVERQGEETSPDRYSEEDCSRPGPACRSNPLIELLPRIMVVMFFLFIIMNSGMLLSSVGGEKQNRTMEVLMLSITPQQMLAGKMLGLGTAGILQSGVWIGGLWTMLRIGGGVMSLPPEFHLPAWLIAVWLLYFLLGYALYASLMAGIGALVPDIKAGSQASGVVMIPLILGYMLSVMPFSIEASNGLLITAISLIPLTSPVPMIMRLTVGVVPFWQLALSLGLMVISVVLVIRAVGKIFRAQMILSGQPFTVRRYLRALLA